MVDPAASFQKVEQAYLKGDIPLRPLPSTMMAHNRASNITLSSANNSNEGNQSSSSGRASNSKRVVRSAPSLITLDDYNLIALGYKPVLSRNLAWISMTGIALTASNVLCGTIGLYGLPLMNGGPAWATWSYLVVGIMSIIVSLCLAELAASYPTTAGVHHWVYQLASTERRPFLTWMTGWLTVAGSIASASSVAFYFSSILGQTLFSIHNIASTPGMLVMFHLGALLFWQFLNLLPVRGLGHISSISSLYIVGVTVAVTTIILSYSPAEGVTVKIPFTVFLNYSGSSSAVYAGLSSALMASFVFCPQDSVLRMSEEVRRPERIVPKLVIGSTVLTLLLGFPLVIALNYGIMHPMKGLLDEAVPAVRIMLTAPGRRLGSIMVSLILAGIFFTGLARLSMATRVAYAFSRDAGLPKSSYWNYLHAKYKTPQRVSWLVTVGCMSGIFPFYWGDNNAFHWIASLACVATNLSFVIPLWLRLTREGTLNYISGPFTLGSLSRFLHAISILWLLFLSAVLMLPTNFPLKRGNFNYASAAIIAIIVLSALSWLKAQYRFTGAAKEGSRAAHRMSYAPSLYQANHAALSSIPGSPGPNHRLHHSHRHSHQSHFGPSRVATSQMHSLRSEHRILGDPRLSSPFPISPSSPYPVSPSSPYPVSPTSPYSYSLSSFPKPPTASHPQTPSSGYPQLRSPRLEATPFTAESGLGNSYSNSGSNRDRSRNGDFVESIDARSRHRSRSPSPGPTHDRHHRRHYGGTSSLASGLPSPQSPGFAITTKTRTSRQSTRSSQPWSPVLGIPLSNSPELLPRELITGKFSSTVSSSHRPSQPDSPIGEKPSSRSTSKSRSRDRGMDPLPLSTPESEHQRALEIEIMRSTVVVEGFGEVPEISIAPPTTISSADSHDSPTTTLSEAFVGTDPETSHAKREELRGITFADHSSSSPPRATPPLASPPLQRPTTSPRYTPPVIERGNHTHSRLPMPMARPLNATERIFPELALTTPTPESASDSSRYPTGVEIDHHDDDYFSRPRPTRKRVPTPYPQKIGQHSPEDDNYENENSDLRGQARRPSAVYIESALQETGIVSPAPQRRPRLERRHAHYPTPLYIPSAHHWKEQNHHQQQQNEYGPSNDDSPRQQCEQSPYGNIDNSNDNTETTRVETSKEANAEAIVASVAAAQNAIKTMQDTRVDESFGDEYLHQYPVVSAYQSTQDLFNVAPATPGQSTGYSTPVGVVQSLASLNDIHDYHNARGTGVDGGEDDKDDNASTSSLVRGVSPFEISSVARDLQEREVDFIGSEIDNGNGHGDVDGKSEVVARWAAEQGRIHEWRMEKKQARVLQKLQKTQKQKKSAQGNTFSSSPPPRNIKAAPKVLLEDEDMDPDLDLGSDYEENAGGDVLE